MKIIHRYVLKQFLKNLASTLILLITLFIVFDAIDRFDKILESEVGFATAIKYFLYKIPLTLNLMLPAAALVSVLFTIGILSKNSEVTAMRASGLTIFWIARPILVASFLLSLLSIFLQETIVPDYTRRVREIYNIDIRKKDQKGTYSQKNFWWRSGDTFYSANMFDSRTGSLLDFSKFTLSSAFSIKDRVDAEEVSYLGPSLGWSMKNVTEYAFAQGEAPTIKSRTSHPLPIPQVAEDFYQAKTDPFTMSYRELRTFIKAQEANGLSVKSYMSDLYAKISFPFVIFIVTLTGLPFALVPARSGSLAFSFLIGTCIGFSYYAVHSFSISLGRAELFPPLVAAWTATILLGLVGFVLNLGAESPA